MKYMRAILVGCLTTNFLQGTEFSLMIEKETSSDVLKKIIPINLDNGDTITIAVGALNNTTAEFTEFTDKKILHNDVKGNPLREVKNIYQNLKKPKINIQNILDDFLQTCLQENKNDQKKITIVCGDGRGNPVDNIKQEDVNIGFLCTNTKIQHNIIVPHEFDKNDVTKLGNAIEFLLKPFTLKDKVFSAKNTVGSKKIMYAQSIQVIKDLIEKANILEKEHEAARSVRKKLHHFLHVVLFSCVAFMTNNLDSGKPDILMNLKIWLTHILKYCWPSKNL